MKALIDPRYNNRVCQIEQDGNIFDVAEPLVWVDCPEGTTTEYVYADGAFSMPTNLDNEQLAGINGLLSDEQKLLLIIEERNKRLQASDWTQLNDVIALHTPQWLEAWVVYRQALRDLPATVDVNNPSFPIPPM